MTDYTVLTDPDAEASIYFSLHSYDEDSRLKYSQIGLMALAVHKRQLYKHRTDPADGFPCSSFARWVRIACPYAFSTVYAAKEDVESLSDVPADVVAQIPQSNFSTMRSLSTAVRRDPQVLEAARGRTEVLVAHVRQRFPGQHIAVRKPVKVMVDDAEMVYSVLDQAVELHDAIDRGHALEMIAAMARKSWELESEVELSIKMEAEHG